MTRLAPLALSLSLWLAAPLAAQAADPVPTPGPTPAPTAGPATTPTPKPEAQRPTVAILYFDYTGKDENLAVLKKGLAQMLITDMADLTAVRIVERDRLQEILDELKLDASAKIDPATAAKVGRLLGARYMVMGGYFELFGSLRVDARVVEVETGRIIHSVGAAGKGDDFLDLQRKVSDGIQKVLVSDAITAGPRGADATPKHTPGHTTNQTADNGAPTHTPGAPATAPSRPRQLRTKTALKYARALDAIDRGNKGEATAALHDVVAEQPDFELAQGELTRLMR